MRIALISYHTFFNPGGVKRHVLGLHKEFKRKGVYCKIIAPRRSFAEKYDKDIILSGISFPLPLLGSKSDFDVNFNPLAIQRILEKEKFDVLHFHNFGFPSSIQIIQQSKALNILTFHSNPKGSKFLMRFPIILKTLEKIANWKIDGVIGVAPLSLTFFRKYSGPKIVIPNGIDVEEFNPKVPKVKKFLDNRLNILYVGRIEKRKGLIYLLKAYRILQKKFDNLRIIVVGDGDEMKKKCQDFIKKYNLREVHFVGAKSGSELTSFYNTADIFVSPSIFGESFGLVLLEAMACGKPVVGFANQGYKQLLAGKAGAKFLVRPRDSKGLAKKIEIFVEDKKLREEMGSQNFKDAQEYSWQKVAERILKFYEFCQKAKQKRKKPSFSLEESFDKLIEKGEKVFNL
jgi:phosphatidylinositol alpha-mannosyltransferase